MSQIPSGVPPRRRPDRPRHHEAHPKDYGSDACYGRRDLIDMNRFSESKNSLSLHDVTVIIFQDTRYKTDCRINTAVIDNCLIMDITI